MAEKKSTSQVFVRVIAARNLAAKGDPDPYCTIFLDKEKKHKTPTLKKTGDPVFEEEKAKIFQVSPKNEELRIVLKGDTFLLPDHFLGQVTFALGSLTDGIPHDEWYPVESRAGKKDKVQGDVHLQVMYTERPDGNVNDEDFAYPIQVLLRKNKFDVLQNLLSTDKYLNTLAIQDKDGNTGLHIAALLDKPDAVELLIKKGADVKAKNAKGQTALHIAAEKSPNSITPLLNGKAEIDAKDSDDETGKRPLHIAALHNNGQACTVLLSKGASVNAQTEKGNTPLHFALRANAFEAVKIIASKSKVDIYKRNKEGQHAAHLALKLGGDIKRIFMDSVKVEDDREFDIVDGGFKKRHRIEGENISSDYQKSNQFLLTTKANTETKILCHYIGLGGDQSINKVGFCVVTTVDGKHAENSYQTNCVGYGSQEPLALTAEQDKKYALLPYSAEEDTKGRFSILVFTKEEDEVELTPLTHWKRTVSASGEWKGNTAGGCNREDTWVNNPRFLLKLPADKEVELYVLLSQQKSTLDIIPFQVHPYAFHVGFYVYNKDVDDIIDRSVWQNAREVYKFLKFDTSKEVNRELVIVPTTVKPGQETAFTVTVYSNEKVELEKIKAAKIIDVNK